MGNTTGKCAGSIGATSIGASFAFRGVPREAWEGRGLTARRKPGEGGLAQFGCDQHMQFVQSLIDDNAP